MEEIAFLQPKGEEKNLKKVVFERDGIVLARPGRTEAAKGKPGFCAC